MAFIQNVEYFIDLVAYGLFVCLATRPNEMQ
jgi:hypothetical protein